MYASVVKLLGRMEALLLSIKCAVKGAGLQRVQLPRGNWFASTPFRLPSGWGDPFAGGFRGALQTPDNRNYRESLAELRGCTPFARPLR